MTGKLKTKGNMMLATKLDGLLNVCSAHVLALDTPSHEFVTDREGEGRQSQTIDASPVTTREQIYFTVLPSFRRRYLHIMRRLNLCLRLG
jgi:hypothetical protein